MHTTRLEYNLNKRKEGIYNSNSLFFSWLGYIFFFLMLVLPTTYQLQRGVLLAVLLLNGVVYALLRGWSLDVRLIFWAFITLTASLFFMLLGAFNDGPGALRVGTVNVLWPILYLFFVGILCRPEKIKPFYCVILFAVIVSAVMGIMVVSERMFGINLFMASIFEELDAGVGLYEGYVEYRLDNMTTVIYGFPFLLATVLLPKDRSPFKGRWRIAAVLGLCLCIVILLVSGRRGFWLIAGFSPLVVWILMASARIKTFSLSRFFSVFLLCSFLVAISTFLGVDLQKVWQQFLRAFDFSDVSNMSAYLRREQFFVLLEGWFDSPLIGHGHGTSASGSLRSVEQPWAYELSYMSLLFHTGAIGMLIYSSSVGWVFWKSIQVMRATPESVTLVLPALSGLTCFLIANATNPYLGKFDYLWVLFLPIGILNAYLLKSQRSI